MSVLCVTHRHMHLTWKLWRSTGSLSRSWDLLLALQRIGADALVQQHAYGAALSNILGHHARERSCSTFHSPSLAAPDTHATLGHASLNTTISQNAESASSSDSSAVHHVTNKVHPVTSATPAHSSCTSIDSFLSTASPGPSPEPSLGHQLQTQLPSSSPLSANQQSPEAPLTPPPPPPFSPDGTSLPIWITQELLPLHLARLSGKDTVAQRKIVLSQFCRQLLVAFKGYPKVITPEPLLAAITALNKLKEALRLHGYVIAQSAVYMELREFVIQQYRSRIGTAKLHFIAKFLKQLALLEYVPDSRLLFLSTRQIFIKPFLLSTIAEDLTTLVEALGLFSGRQYLPPKNVVDLLAEKAIRSLDKFSPDQLAVFMKSTGHLGVNPLEGALTYEALRYAWIYKDRFALSPLIHLMCGAAHTKAGIKPELLLKLLEFVDRSISHAPQALEHTDVTYWLEACAQYRYIPRSEPMLRAVSQRICEMQKFHRLYYLSSLANSISLLKLPITDAAKQNMVKLFHVAVGGRGPKARIQRAEVVKVLSLGNCLSRMGLLTAEDVLKLMLYIESSGVDIEDVKWLRLLYRLTVIPLAAARQKEAGLVRQVQAHRLYSNARTAHQMIPVPLSPSWPIQQVSTVLLAAGVQHSCNARIRDGTVVDIVLKDSRAKHVCIVIHRPDSFSATAPYRLLGKATEQVQILQTLGYTVVQLAQHMLQVTAPTSRSQHQYIMNQIADQGVIIGDEHDPTMYEDWDI